jgi:hypothetical protein
MEHNSWNLQQDGMFRDYIPLYDKKKSQKNRQKRRGGNFSQKRQAELWMQIIPQPTLYSGEGS